MKKMWFLLMPGIFQFVNFSVVLPVSAGEEMGFHEQRKEFRKKIDTKEETPIEGAKDVSVVYFAEDKGRFTFSVQPGEVARVKEILVDYYEQDEDAVLERFIDQLKSGGLLLGKEYSEKRDSVLIKSAFLMPPYPYWDRLTNVDGIENTFAVYNTSVEFFVEENRHYCYLQTEGTFFKVTRALNVPVIYFLEAEKREMNYRMPTQEELDRAAAGMQPVNPERTEPEQKFIDHCRRHPLFSEKDLKERYLIREKEIRKIYPQIFDLKECEVKVTEGGWKVYEGFSGFHLVTFTLKSVVNIEAFVPKIPLVRNLVEKFAQTVSDEVSVKYLPLSMKNLRDWVITDEEGKSEEE